MMTLSGTIYVKSTTSLRDADHIFAISFCDSGVCDDVAANVLPSAKSDFVPGLYEARRVFQRAIALDGLCGLTECLKKPSICQYSL